MNKLGTVLLLIFTALVAFYFLVLKPEEYKEPDLLEEIIKRDYIKVGVNMDSKPFCYFDANGNLVGYDVDLARAIAQNILHNSQKVKFVAVTTSNRMIKASTGEADIVIATMTITPQRREVIEFSIPYDMAGQAILVNKDSQIKSMGDLSGQDVGVIWGTTAEKNMTNLLPTANVVGFKSYNNAYYALKSNKINAITSDDTILNRFAIDDKDVVLLPKRYSKEPYGIGFKKGKGSVKFKQRLNEAITDLKQKNVLNRIHKKWLG